jgi:hypothetical protein
MDVQVLIVIGMFKTHKYLTNNISYHKEKTIPNETYDS